MSNDTPITLANWSVANPPGYSRYRATELCPGISMQGVVNGHPRLPDGEGIVTSQIVRAEGLDVYTESGSHYRLIGPPDPGFVEWCKCHYDKPVDWSNPIRFPEA